MFAFLHPDKQPPTDPKSPAKSITFAYLLAFVIIALFSLAIHFSTNLLMKQLAESAEVTYHLSAIRTLVQRMPYQLSAFKEHESEVDQARLANSLQRIEASRAYIEKEINSEDTISKDLTDIFYGSRFNLNEELLTHTYIVSRCASLDIQYQDASEVCKEVEQVLKKLDREKELLASLDIALTNYRTETLNKIDFYHGMQRAGIIIILLVLVLEAFLIFRPLIVKIDSYYTLLLEQALQDPMTGLKNRRAFLSQAEAELSQAQRNKNPIAIALMDLDKFKSINDTYGHDVGDAVIKHFGNELKMRMRRGDIIGRIGGEEFAVVLVRPTNDEEAFSVINRVRKAVEQASCPYTDANGERKELSYTTSIGVYSLVPEGENVEEMLKKADEMLYKAKESGRNKVVLTNAEGKIVESQD